MAANNRRSHLTDQEAVLNRMMREVIRSTPCLPFKQWGKSRAGRDPQHPPRPLEAVWNEYLDMADSTDDHRSTPTNNVVATPHDSVSSGPKDTRA